VEEQAGGDGGVGGWEGDVGFCAGEGGGVAAGLEVGGWRG